MKSLLKAVALLGIGLGVGYSVGYIDALKDVRKADGEKDVTWYDTFLDVAETLR